mgnify:CR=1 FL=1
MIRLTQNQQQTLEVVHLLLATIHLDQAINSGNSSSNTNTSNTNSDSNNTAKASTPARDETVTTGYKCSCGEMK